MATETNGEALIKGEFERLQWGRRSLATETQLVRRRVAVASAASMGPSLVGDGNPSIAKKSSRKNELQWGRRSLATETPAAAPPPTASTSLQWGRRSLATETRFSGREGRRRSLLQWGRRSLATETRRSVIPRARIGPLQWGRRSLATETLCGRTSYRGLTRASMGPSLVGDGNRVNHVGCGFCETSFNGAVARWRRKPAARRLLVPPHSRFNGAVARWRRKLFGRASFRSRASRLQWGRRSLATETRHGKPDGSRSGVGFNGAVARWRRKLIDYAKPLGRWNAASMGPSLVGDGNRHFALGQEGCKGLQWGRRSLATETAGGVPGAGGSGCFNGAVARWRRKRRPTT